MFDPTPIEIAGALHLPHACIEHVYDNWPSIKEALHKFGITRDSGLIATIATIGAECSVFKPIAEYGNPAYWREMYDVTSSKADRRAAAIANGNTTPGDGVKYRGRGYFQHTWKNNYAALSKVTGIDLVANPDKLLEPSVAALGAAWYARTHGIDAWAEKAMTSTPLACPACPKKGLMRDYLVRTGHASVTQTRRPRLDERTCSWCGWMTVRRIVNGGLNGWDRFKSNVITLQKLVKP